MAKIAGDHLLKVLSQQLHLIMKDTSPEEVSRLIRASGLERQILENPEQFLHITAEELAEQLTHQR